VGLERLIPLVVLAALATGCQGDGTSGGGEGSAPAGEEAVVEWVNDGDTLTLEDGTRVRLVQIDAPELHTDCYGRPALQALIDLAPKGTRVTLARDPALDAEDEHGRVLRYVFAGDRNVNVELVRRGAASPYFFRSDRGRYADELLDAVEDARDAERGYWGACRRAELNTGIGSVTGPA
jgi:endonuclease YncB( thermonuclease family)